MYKWLENNILKGKRPYILILALGFLVYSQTLIFDFAYLDDNTLILDNNYYISQFSNIFKAFGEDVFISYTDAYYRPILTISLIIDAQISGTSPFFYHFSNVIIHLIASCLVFLLFKKLNYKRDISLFFSLIFTVHPVLTQAIAWIPGRNDSLLAIFVLASFISFLNYLESKKRNYLFWHFLFFALAIFTKESAVAVIPMAIFYLHFIVKEKIFSQNKKLLSIGWFPIVVLWFILRKLAFQSPIEMPLTSMLKSLFSNFPAAIQLIGKIFFPFNLSVIPVIKDTTFVYGIISVLIILILLFFSKNKRWNYVFFGMAWFFLFLLPSFIRLYSGTADFFEHRLYLPIVGCFIFLMEIKRIRKIDFKKNYILISSGCVLILFSALTINYEKNFKNRLSFWEDGCWHSPHSPLAHRNLGAMYYLENRPEESEKEYLKTLELSPNEEMVHNNLGLIYFNRGEYGRAEEEYEKELEINPHYDNAYSNMGLLYYKTQRLDEAEKAWNKVLEINPTRNDILYNLAALYYEQKKFKEASAYAGEIAKRGLKLPPELQNLLNPLNLMQNTNGK